MKDTLLFMIKHDMKLLSASWSWKQSSKDRLIMTELYKVTKDKTVLSKLNECRLWLGVQSLSDISDVNLTGPILYNSHEILRARSYKTRGRKTQQKQALDWKLWDRYISLCGTTRSNKWESTLGRWVQKGNDNWLWWYSTDLDRLYKRHKEIWW